MSKKNTFILMNTLMKGTAANIQAALSKLDPKSYELIEFTYHHKKADIYDASIVKAGIVFKEIQTMQNRHSDENFYKIQGGYL